MKSVVAYVALSTLSLLFLNSAQVELSLLFQLVDIDYILHIYITDLIAFAYFIFFISFVFNFHFHFKLMVELAPFFTFFIS